LYGRVTWALTLREEHRLRVIGRIFGRKRDEVTGGWKNNEEVHNLYSSPDIIRATKSKRIDWRFMHHGGGEKCKQNVGHNT
jgi:hypothetical protein